MTSSDNGPTSLALSLQDIKIDTTYDPNSLAFGVDLVGAAKKLLEFLHLVDRCPVLYDEAIVLEAIRRYELFWLPLAAQHGGELLAAPLDIAWIWHVHLLAPYYYEQDCRNLVNTTVDHKILVGHEREVAQLRAQALWEKEYPNEPFVISYHVRHSDFKSQISYNLQLAVARQRVFFYQVSLPHYADNKFLEAAKERYKKYLFLKQSNPKLFLVPCYDFDLIWHAHQNYPAIYKSDTDSILGRMLNHDDSVNDRSPGSKLLLSDTQTRQLWKKTFNEDFALNGAMFRGEPPSAFLVPTKPMDAYATRQCTIVLQEVYILNLPSDDNFTVKVDIAGGGRICKLGGSHKSWKGRSSDGLAKFRFDTAIHSTLKFDVEAKKLFVKGFHGTAAVPVATDLVDVAEEGHHISHSTELMSEDGNPSGVTLNFTIKVTSIRKGHYIFNIRPGRYESSNVPDILHGHIPLARPSEVSNKCETAVHKVYPRISERCVAFTVRVIHSQELMMSAIQVYARESDMAATAHLIGPDTLPTRQQVTDEGAYCTLDHSSGERAILIKGKTDWGICVGKWEGFRPGVPGKPGIPSVDGRPPIKGVKGVPMNPGHLKVGFYSLQGKQGWQLAVRRDKGMTFQMDCVSVNITNGKIIIPAHVEQVPEAIALAFAISVLWVLCNPKSIRQTPQVQQQHHSCNQSHSQQQQKHQSNAHRSGDQDQRSTNKWG
ncbi:Hypp5584 [Branchiostoma lanceolatum]|uniref:Hypp5584 protein n=1 Tax=Branchiostoma lanceolatum TaxID=7740 RepID=A0A8J9YLH1_BRALA|nr:Hypp5584 [Branchiostoma lanceolatum]